MEYYGEILELKNPDSLGVIRLSSKYSTYLNEVEKTTIDNYLHQNYLINKVQTKRGNIFYVGQRILKFGELDLPVHLQPNRVIERFVIRDNKILVDTIDRRYFTLFEIDSHEDKPNIDLPTKIEDWLAKFFNFFKIKQ